ncbi:MAG: leucine--tRNA ligase [Oscillospiraceae bacterium]|nr:leucine--tRNA ligase [Oscillospiraceae bacterium]
MEYNFKEIEKKWQAVWDDEKAFAATNDYSKPKFFGLVEFPYPSGQGLHVGHPRSYTALDIISRKKRLQGFNVLYPMGWDAFGLPTENYAIKNHIHPEIVTEKNVANFKRQLKALGFSFDWDREVNTTDPAYYKWTQWIFLQLFKKGLAYKKKMSVNWCTSCKCVLANEEVVNGVCERCGSEVIHKDKEQWMLKITEYAQRLIDDLADVNYIERVKTSQINWIGRSVGAEVDFATTAGDNLRIYTTRPDTLFGATYMVISPEHPLIDKWKDLLTNFDEVMAYRAEAARKSDFERTELVKDKTGVKLSGITAINPVNNTEIPIFVSDYVLMTYGTGAIMAVPAHDTRDYDFAKAFSLPIIEVVAGGDIEKEAFTDCQTGTMVNSGFLNGMSVEEAKKAIVEWLEKEKKGYPKVNFKLRDWVFSRQRYWGEPIPMVYCEKCGWVPLDESELPLKLPEVEHYEPTDNGESPLAAIEDWVNTTCPHCGGKAKRETDTMPQWAGSSWYFLRYCDPDNVNALAAKEALDYWMPVDWYNGGMEHTTLHLLYSRFWHKFLYDIGVVSTAEPYSKRTSHGMILGENGEKMSKSRGNVVNPDDIINDYGADTMRLYEMFIGDFEKAAPWSTSSIRGCKRFLDKIWNLQEIVVDGEYRKELESSMYKTIKKVGDDIEAMKFNTGIAAMMTLLNEIGETKVITREEYKTILILLNPFAPHITEEIWQNLGFEGRVYQQAWPEFDESKCKDDVIEIIVQLNGKLRDKLKIAADASKDDMLKAAYALEKVSSGIEGKTVVKEIVVPGRLVNIVVK